jgi:hypothetical protein
MWMTWYGQMWYTPGLPGCKFFYFIRLTNKKTQPKFLLTHLTLSSADTEHRNTSTITAISSLIFMLVTVIVLNPKTKK